MDTAIIISGIILFIVIKGIYDRKHYYNNLVIRLKKCWGQVPEEEYTSEKLKSLKSYYNSIKNEAQDVDDITWNDLDMEQIYMLVNNTRSSIGEEYLYSVLRKVKFEKEELLERNRLIELFQNNPDQRLKLQVALNRVGKLNNISVYEYMNLLNSLEEKSSLPHYFMAIGLCLSIALIFINPAIGGVLTVFMVCNNIIQYFRRKAEIDSYLSVCSYIIRLLFSIKDIIDLDISDLRTYSEQLQRASEQFKEFKKGYRVLVAKTPNGDMSDIIIDYFRMLFHPDLIKFNSMLKIFKKNRKVLNEMFQTIGTLDSMIAVASFRDLLDYYTLPEFSNDTKPFIEVEELYHPLIDDPVTNTFAEQRCVLITGSNASGKSTFIKSLAINAILSQTIYTSTSKCYNASFFQIATSMALKDNIFSKESYYIVEIKSLKRILDRLNDKIPTLCFIDEVLRGTNTLERIAASSQILYSLANTNGPGTDINYSNNALCFAATHDIELTHILEKYYSNYHFQEQIIDNNVVFDYKLYKGRANSRNAIKLLEVIGYSKDITKKAYDEANEFLESGTWNLLE